MKLYLTSFFLFFCFLLNGQSVIGDWIIKTKHGVPESRINIYEENGVLYARCVELLEGAKLTHCKKCKGDDKNKPLVGMLLFKDCKKKGKKWINGSILDPEKGKFYGCQVSLKSDNTLKVRGYIGKPLFGKTLYWYRAE